MMKRIQYLFFFIFFFLCLSNLNEVRGQCGFQIIAPNPVTGVPTATNNPIWQTCENNGNFVVTLQTTAPITTGFTIIWGDGSAPQHVNGPWVGFPAITHSYTVSPTLPSKNDTTYNFQLILDPPNNACVKTGQIVIKKIPRPIIQIADGKFKVCAPEHVSFINKSENVDNTTTFFVQFGDGTDTVLDHTSVGQTFTHLYDVQTVNCVTSIRITAQKSGCLSFSSSIDPLYVWDKDTVQAQVLPLRVCRSTDTVTFRNTSLWNCDGIRDVNGIPTSEGNTTPPNPPRRDRWRIVGPTGTFPFLVDTIIDWRPANSEVRMVLPAIGEYCGTVVHESFCGIDSAEVCVIYNQPPVANIGPDDTVCAGNVLQLNNSLGTTTNVTYQWNVLAPTGGVTPTSSTSANPNFTFNNATGANVTRRIELIVRSTGGNPTSCSDRDTISIVIRPKPTANFTLNTTAGNITACDSIVVNFAETSTNENKWEWDFNNDGVYDTVITAAGVNPSPRKFFALTTAAGTNTITVNLRVTGANGCMDSITRQIRVFRSPIPAFTAVSVCVGKAATFNSSTTQWFPSGVSGKTYSWSFPGGTPSTSTAANPNNIVYNAAGTYVVTLTVSATGLGPAGCPQTIVDTIRVEPPPVTSFTMNGSNGNISGCSPFTVNFGNTSTGANTNFWKLIVGSASDTTSIVSPVKTYVNNGTTNMVVQVRLITRTQFGCADSLTKTITIFPNPNASFTVSNNTIFCNPPPIRFTNTSTGAVTAIWDYGDGSPLDTVAIGAIRNHQYTNTSAIIRVDTVKMIAINATGCRDTFMVPVQIFPSQSFSVIVNADSGCTPFTTSFTAINGAAAYIWDFGNGQGSISQNSSSTFHNNSTADTTYLVRLITITAFGCRDTSFQNIVVHPLPRTTFSENSGIYSGCTPFTAYFNTFNSDGPVRYDWDFNDGTTVNNYTEDTISHTFVNTTTAPLVRTVRVKGYNAKGCATDTTRQVTIYPLVEAKFRIDTVSCSPYRDTIINESAGATNYRWYINGILQTSMNNQSSPVINLVNNSVLPDTFMITLQVQSPFSAACTDVYNQQVVINPTPKVVIDPDTMVGCQPLIVNFTNQTVGGTIYAWDFGDGNISSSSAASVQHTYTNTGSIPVVRTITLRVENTFGCAEDTSINITVYPVIESLFTIDTVSCSPFRDTIINQSTNATNYRWFFDGVLQTALNGQANPVILLSNNTTVPDTVEIRLESESPFHNSCRDDFTKKVVILPVPELNIDPDTTEGCHPLTINFLNQSTVPAGSVYNWDFDNGNFSSSSAPVVSQTFVNTGMVPRVYNVTLTITSPSNPQCIKDTTIAITVYPRVVPDFTMDTLMCSPFIDTAINTSVGGIRYYWRLDNGTERSIQDFPLHVVTPGIHTLTLRIESPFACTNTITKTFRVLPLPNVAFTPDTTRFCHPATISFFNQTTGATSYEWDFGDGATSTSAAPIITHTFVNTGTDSIIFPVKLRATTIDTCTAERIVNITVFPQVISNFTLPDTLCSPYVATANNTSTGATEYEWSVNHVYQGDEEDKEFTLINNAISPRNDTIRLRAYSRWGCDSILQKVVTVLPKPNASFVMSAGNTCQPRTIQFTNLSTQDVGMQYTWELGSEIFQTTDPSTFERTFSNMTSQTITYPIKLTCTNRYGCISQFDTSINISPYVLAKFAVPEKGCTPFTFKPDNQSINASSYLWSWSDDNGPNTSPLSEPDITLVNKSLSTTKVFNVTLTVISPDLCPSDTTIEVIVYPTPDPDFSVFPQTTTIFPNTLFTFKANNETQLGNYTWDFGDGTTSNATNPGNHNYATWGEYEVKLIIENDECIDSSTVLVKIRPPRPIPAFIGQAEGCPPQTVQFNNVSQYGKSYKWDFGDNTTSDEEQPVHTYYFPGVYNVELKVYGFEDGVVEQTIKLDSVVVHPVPTAFFKSQPKTVYLPSDPLVCYNLSADATAYEWDFGDGTNSTETSPQHYYTKPGEYTIVLIATNEFDCKDTFSVENAVIAESEGSVQVPNAFTPNPNGGSGGFFNPQDFNNDVFYPLIKGVQEYYLSIYNRWGELLFESRDLHIGWDGYYRGKLCKQDVYVWKIEAKFSDGRRINKAGDVLLLR